MSDKKAADKSSDKPEVIQPQTSPELPSKGMDDAKQDNLVHVTEDEAENKVAEETGKDQPLPEDVEEINNLKDSEVAEIANEAAAAVAAEPNPPVDRAVVSPKGSKFARCKAWCGRHKFWTAVLALLVALGVLAAIPFTRFAIGGLFLTQDFQVYVTDTETKKPISSATVIVDGKKGTTNSGGYVTITQKVGPAKVDVNKPYYKASQTNTVVPILTQKKPLTVSLKATGYKTSLTVIDKISGKPLESVLVTADGGIESSTNAKGVAELVVPADVKTLQVKLMLGNYNTATTEITVGEALKANEFSLTPSGKVYFLSNKGGKIDVVKTNLDGSDRQVVVAGTGKEESNTTLLASRDWKYLALFSKRDGGTAKKLFLIDTSTDKMTEMDSGDAEFNLIGWSGHTFTYNIYRNGYEAWQPKRQAIKSFNADTRKLSTLDENDASNDRNNAFFQHFGNFYILDGKLVYNTGWDAGHADKPYTIRAINFSNNNKKDVLSLPGNEYWGYQGALVYEPQSIYFSFTKRADSSLQWYEYENGTAKPTTDTITYKPYPTFLLSPSGKQTLWSDTRDGKLALFTGTAQGEGEQQIPGISDYSAYGWFSDNYVLATQKGSELYILSKEGSKPVKISDYYKPQGFDFRGYGSGYGGL